MGDMTDAVEAAIGAADHLMPADGAAVALLRSWAGRLDQNMPVDIPPGFLRLLTALGLTPVGRKGLPVEDKPAAGPLTGIRQRRKGAAK